MEGAPREAALTWSVAQEGGLGFAIKRATGMLPMGSPGGFTFWRLPRQGFWDPLQLDHPVILQKGHMAGEVRNTGSEVSRIGTPVPALSSQVSVLCLGFSSVKWE